MHAIILSAGRGSRMSGYTDEAPKCLVRVDGGTILDRQLDALALAGCAGATIIGGYRIDQVSAHLRSKAPRLPVDLRFNPFWSVSGSIGSVWAARDLLDEAIFLLNGDTIFDGTALAPMVEAAGDIALLVEEVSSPSLDDMLVHVRSGLVLNVSKALPADVATHRSLGVIAAQRGSGYAAALETVIASPGGVHSYHHDVVDAASLRRGVTAVEHRGGPWVEIDRPEDLEVWQAKAAYFG